MLPKKEMNIYPRNPSNIDSLVKFYFARFDLDLEGAINLINEKTSLELNQIEFICRKINESYLTVFKPNLNGKIALKNLLTYAIDALTLEQSNWLGSKNRIRITTEFMEFVQRTEVDINYLERNN